MVPDAETERAVERALASFPDAGAGERVVFGFDGYVDRVREVVADRDGPDDYDRLDRLSGFGDRVNRSVEAGSSLSFEWFQRGTRTGGHTSHLSRAFANWGFDPVMIGMYGRPELSVFESEFSDCERFSLGEPGYTDAVEFDDGKLMLIENGDTTALDWATLCDRVSRETLVDRLDGAALLGVGYWAETPDLPDVLAGLRDLWDDLTDPPATVVVDPGDVRKLDRDRLRAGRAALARLDEVTRVALTANRAETRLLAATYGEGGDALGDEAGEAAGGEDVDAAGDAEDDLDATAAGDAADAPATADADSLADARTVREALSVSLVVCHGIDRSVVAGPDVATGVAVPAVEDPELTTSSGDHFNAGLALALVAGLDPGPAVAVGNAVAGQFVRTGESPALDDVRSLLETYGSQFSDP